MIYKLKPGARLAVKAQVAGEECERLSNENRLTPHNLVEDSRPESAPLHNCFEWNDSIAAEKFRESQAYYIIRSVTVDIDSTREPTRAFVVTVSDDKHTYKDVGYVLRNQDSRSALIESARRDLIAFKRKYQSLTELAKVIDAIDGVIGSQQSMSFA